MLYRRSRRKMCSVIFSLKMPVILNETPRLKRWFSLAKFVCFLNNNRNAEKLKKYVIGYGNLSISPEYIQQNQQC